MSEQSSLIGTTLGQYQILDELGRGGMSIVYKAWQPSLRRYVALKVLQPHLTNDWEFVQRFQQEAIVAANLRHPNIVTIYEVAQQDRQLFIAMEFVEGRSLEAIIKQEGALTLPRTVALLRQVAAALDYAHERRFVHRDIKPANIMVTPDERVVITDFGIAKAMEGSGATARITQAGSVLGTIEYMAPEQIQGQPPDYRADLYSLGIVAYEMLTGRIPFDSPTTASLLYAQVNLLPPDVRQLAPALPPSVAQALARMLAKSPADRFPSAGAFVEALSGTTPAEAPKAQTAVLPPGYQPAPQPWPATVPMGSSAPTMVSPPVTPGVAPYPAPTTATGKKSKGWLWAGLAAGGVVLCLVMAIGIYLLFFRGPTVAQLIQDGQQALAAAQYPEAEEAFAAALEKEPDNPTAHRGLGWVYYNTGDYEQAVAEFTKAVALEPANAEGYRGKGLSYFELGKNEEALEPLKKWAEMMPDNAEAHNKLGWALLNLKRYEEAVPAFTRSLEIEETAGAYQGLGTSYYNLRAYEQALTASEKWAALEPNNAKAHSQIGWTLLNLKRYEEAVPAFTRSLEIEETAGAYQGLGTSYYNLRAYEQALTASEKWAALEPNNAKAHHQIGWTLLNLKRYEEAVPAFTRSLEIEKTAGAYQGLGTSYYNLRAYEQALTASEKWAALEPDNAKAHNLVGWTLLNLKRYEEAESAFSRALELEKTADAYRGLADSLYNQQDYESALKFYQECLVLDQQNAQVHAQIGWCYVYLKDCQNAQTSFQKALEINPSLESAQQGMQKCR